MVSRAERSSEPGPSGGRPAYANAALPAVAARTMRRGGLTPRKKRSDLKPSPPTAVGRAAQLMDTMELRGVGRGGAPIHVTEKELTRTDVDVDQCRLQLTPDLVDGLLGSPILTDAEKAVLRSGTSQGLDVKAVDRADNEYDMVFKFTESCRQYRIVKWAQFCVDHDLAAGKTMAVWFYRQPPPPPVPRPGEIGRLGLVLLPYDRGDEKQKKMDAELLDRNFVECAQALLMMARQSAAAAAAAAAAADN